MSIEAWLAFVAATAILVVIPHIAGGSLLSIAGAWASLAKRATS